MKAKHFDDFVLWALSEGIVSETDAFNLTRGATTNKQREAAYQYLIKWLHKKSALYWSKLPIEDRKSATRELMQG